MDFEIGSRVCIKNIIPAPINPQIWEMTEELGLASPVAIGRCGIIQEMDNDSINILLDGETNMVGFDPEEVELELVQ